MADEKSEKSAFESLATKGIQLLLVAAVVWAGSQLVKLGHQSVILEERMTQQGMLLQEMRVEIREWGETYYRRADAQRELGALEVRMESLESRINDIERQ